MKNILFTRGKLISLCEEIKDKECRDFTPMGYKSVGLRRAERLRNYFGVKAEIPSKLYYKIL